LHPSLAGRLDALHPAVLRLIDRATQSCRDQRIEVGVCGATASDPEAVPVLIGLGVRELSVVPAQIPRVKSLLRTLDPERCAALARQALSLSNAVAVRTLVRDWTGGNA
jgi:multiphosphoryl transfer protein